jgi:hypothetical protein
MSRFSHFRCVSFLKPVISRFDRTIGDKEMSKRLFAIMFAATVFAALYASAAQAQTSQTIVVNVPFTFTTNNKSLPAGTYRIEPASDNRALWMIRDGSNNPDRFLLAVMITGKAGNDARVTFHRYGDKYFLVGFRTASYEIGLPKSHQDKNLMAAGPAAPADVVNIPVELGGSH